MVNNALINRVIKYSTIWTTNTS